MIVVNESGPACPRCGRLMEVGRRPVPVREHGRSPQKQLREAYYLKRWFFCLHPGGLTVMWDDQL